MSEEDGQGNVAKRISKDVLKMNFMKRTTVRIEKQQKAQQLQQVNDAIASGKLAVEPPQFYPTVEHIDDDPNCTLGGVMTEWRYSVLEEQKFGRFSYHGQNPEIEVYICYSHELLTYQKLMLFHERRRLGLVDPDEEKNIEEEESNDGDDGRESGELSSSDEERMNETNNKQEEEEADEPPRKKLRPDLHRHQAPAAKTHRRNGNKPDKRTRGRKQMRTGGEKQQQHSERTNPGNRRGKRTHRNGKTSKS